MWVSKLSVDANGAWSAEPPAEAQAPSLVLLFGPTDLLRASPAPAQLARQFPAAIQLGCSTGTALDGLTLNDDALSATAIGFANTPLRLATAELAGAADSHAAGRAIGEQLAADDLAAVFILSDGLGVNGSALVGGIAQACGDRVVISGGLAGDGARFADTLVTVGGASASGTVAAVGFYGSSIRVGHGSAGGWDEFGPVRQITRSNGNVLSELEGKPALELYEKYLGEEAADLPASALFYPLKIWNPDRPEDAVVRTVLAINRDDRTMTFAGDIPEGWSARLMRGSFDRLTEGAGEAARHARDSLASGNVEASLCLLVSCVGRRLLMGQRAEEEIEAVAHVLGSATAIAGFYSYGEIAPSNATKVPGLHNQTMTLTLLAEAC
jgi:hypothetical protein